MQNKNIFLHNIIDDIELILTNNNFIYGRHSSVELLTLILNVIMGKLPYDEYSDEAFVIDLSLEVLNQFITVTDSNIDDFRNDLICLYNLIID